MKTILIIIASLAAYSAFGGPTYRELFPPATKITKITKRASRYKAPIRTKVVSVYVLKHRYIVNVK